LRLFLTHQNLVNSKCKTFGFKKAKLSLPNLT
jgi:hypothetical protein